MSDRHTDERLDRIYHAVLDGNRAIAGQMHSLHQKIIKLMSNTDIALADLQSIKDQLAKIGTESAKSLQTIIDLETAAAAADTPQSVLDAIAAVKVQVQAVDDLVPDAPVQS